MPDGRMLSKTIAHSVQLSGVSLEADYLFTRCIPHLDREGRMPGNARLVKLIACPLREEVTTDAVPDLICQLVKAGLVRWYTVDGTDVLEFPGFKNHQKGARFDREAPSRFPAPTPDQLRTNSGPEPDRLPLSEVKSSEVKSSEAVAAAVREETPISEPAPAEAPTVPDVEAHVNQIIRAANRGMHENPETEGCRPISVTHGNSRQVVHDWMKAGIAADFAERVVQEKARAAGQKISSLKYFDGLVREAHELALSGSSGNGQRRNGTNGKKPADWQDYGEGTTKFMGLNG